MIKGSYDELFKKMKEEGFYGAVMFKMIAGEVKLIRFESTFKNIDDALLGKTTGD